MGTWRPQTNSSLPPCSLRSPARRYARLLRETDLNHIPVMSRGWEGGTGVGGGAGADRDGWDEFVKESVAVKEEYARRFHEEVVPLLVETLPLTFTNDQLDYRKVLWALTIVDSRYFWIPDDERRADPAAPPGDSYVVPFVDMMNFPSSEDKWACVRCDVEKVDGEYYFQCTAECDFEEGEEVVFYYGDHCKSFMKSQYGFYNDLNYDECGEDDWVLLGLDSWDGFGEGEGEWEEEEEEVTQVEREL